MFIDKLDDKVSEGNNTYHRIIRVNTLTHVIE